MNGSSFLQGRLVEGQAGLGDIGLARRLLTLRTAAELMEDSIFQIEVALRCRAEALVFQQLRPEFWSVTHSTCRGHVGDDDFQAGVIRQRQQFFGELMMLIEPDKRGIARDCHADMVLLPRSRV